MFALDRSTSISQKNFQVQVDLIKNLVSNLNFNMHRVGLVSFGRDVKIHLNIDEHQNRQTLLDVLDLYFTGGTTNTGDALKTIRKSVFTADRSRLYK